MNRHFCAAFLGIFVAAWCFGQTNFATGEDLFLRNKPDEAAPYLESAIAEEPGNITAFLYLGIVYEQLDRAADAIGIYRQVVDRAGELTANVANNLGNAYFTTGDASQAEASYSQAITADRTFAAAWLGRANTRLKKGSLRGAAADYGQYLLLEPGASQREAIEQLLAGVQAELANSGAPLSPTDAVSEPVKSVADAGEDDYE